MKQRLFRSILCLTSICVCLVAALFFWLGYRYITTDAYTSLRREATLLLETDAEGRITVKQLQRTQLADRVTLLDPDGQVLFDNYADAAALDNHLGRPEVRQALAQGEGTARRASATLGENIFYYAVALPDGNILRLARTHNIIFQQVNLLAAYLLLLVAVIFGGAFLAARSLTRRVLRPLEQLDLESADPQTVVYPELRPIVEHFSEQQQKLQREMRRYKNKKKELKAVGNNMDEGMLFLDTDWNVVSMNKSAVRFSGREKQDVLGKNIFELIDTEEMHSLMEELATAGKGSLVVDRGSTYYQFNGSRIADKGFVLLIMDVTERTASEKLRREFSANVSHELKTPLQSVLGYSEIILSGLVKPEDTKRFLQKIYDEARNLLQLIDDVIKLSKLDELNYDILEEFSLSRTAESALSRLRDKAAKAGVELIMENKIAVGGSLLGIPSLMEEIFFNLVDNGIKYNHAGGSVTVRLEETESKYTVCVADTGMGIAAAELPHIFERFYRVDRSRHKAIEGTGLGLSIVKHGVMFHKGTVRVTSAVGKGTEFTLKFPKELKC